MMDLDMGFDIHAMTDPKTPEDYLNLLKEATRLITEVNGHLKDINDELEKKFPGRTNS